MPDPLDAFSAATRSWFREALGEPTPPQVQGWPAIQRGDHTLILAPTGSGKTIAAFLWGIDRIYHDVGQNDTRGIQLLYVSPLKALNNDVERNLERPLAGIRAAAERLGSPLPALRVAVRTGDTPSAARAQMLKSPPHILITTPESLYLMLTSPRGREIFRTVRNVIVDEIHTLVGDKRGAHLAVSLERLTHLAANPIQRIGLSATVKPVEEAARFLGGQDVRGQAVTPRPVTIVNAHYPKQLDLEVVTAVEDFRALPGASIWPAIIPLVLKDIQEHRSTLIFCNNRRLAERTADRLNAQLSAETNKLIEPGSTAALTPGGQMTDRGIFAIGAHGPIQAHHGSMSKEARKQMEGDLKAGALPALVGTSSLELGIDIGAVDLVVQLQSPKSVSQGLQRVGRSGHLVGQVSHGRIYATFREDLLEAAAVARGMLDRDVEPTYAPQNPLDVLSQHIVAMVAMEDWPAADLFALVRGAYSYQDLPLAAFHSVLAMLAGGYYVDAPNARAASSLRAKIAWDRTHDRLTALPGSRMLAMSNVGTIPDTGAYGAYLSDGKTKIGELDEEFVFETRVGDAFLLGSAVWRVSEIKDDRVIIIDAAGATPRMPFWRGDSPHRPYELGARLGAFRRALSERLIRLAPGEPDDAIADWLKRDYVLDDYSARNLIDHVQRQLEAMDAMSSDRTIVAEAFENEVGDPFLVLHSPFGGRVNGAWAIALSGAIRERTHMTPEMQVSDDGILFHFAQTDRALPLDILKRMTPAEARERILQGLPGSAVFGAQFRKNAGRALLMPRQVGQKRTPFWLQRMKARDLLAIVSGLENFPIVIETYRDCLRDVFDLPHLEQVLSGIQSGDINVIAVETATPSPIAASLLYNFSNTYMYEWDAPKAERQLQTLSLPRQALAELLKDKSMSDLIRPQAIAEITTRAQHLAPGFQARMIEELALLLRELGDLSTEEAMARCTAGGRAWLEELAERGRVIELSIGPNRRWIPVELADEYRAIDSAAAAENILRRFLRHAGPVTTDSILARYPVDPVWLDRLLSKHVEQGDLVRSAFTASGANEYCDAHALDQIHQRTLIQLRREVQPVSLYAYADFLARWQHAHPHTQASGAGLRSIIEQLRGASAPSIAWERDILPARIDGYARGLDELSDSGDLVWVCSGRDLRRGHTRFFFRGEGGLFLQPPDEALLSQLDERSKAAYDFLKSEGASFPAEIGASLRLPPAELSRALSELMMAGLITHDAYDTLRRLLSADQPDLHAAQPAVGRLAAPPRSALEEDLAARLGPRDPARLTSGRFRDAKRRVRERMRVELPSQPAEISRVSAGRWSLVHRVSIMGPAEPNTARADALVRALLNRYGVVARECVLREALPWDWSQLYPLFERMEMRGEVRRGYFVAGLSGAQFALPDAVELLRSASAQGSHTPAQDEPVVLLNATDPASILGGDLGEAGLRYTRLPSTMVALWRGQPVVVFEDNGERISVEEDAPGEIIAQAVSAYVFRPNSPRRLVVLAWNGAPVEDGPGFGMLKRLGFTAAPRGVEHWRTDQST